MWPGNDIVVTVQTEPGWVIDFPGGGVTSDSKGNATFKVSAPRDPAYYNIDVWLLGKATALEVESFSRSLPRVTTFVVVQ